jgi:hypothetical protein
MIKMKGIHNILLSLLFVASFGSVSAQHFIGLNPVEIATLMKSEQPQFKLDKNAINNTYKYLKYVDKISEQTILLFLSDKDICTYVRWMSDYANLNDMISKLNNSYKKTGVNTWSYIHKGENYTVKLEEEEWYFTITFRKN